MRRSRVFLAVAVVLLIVAAWLMSGAEKVTTRARQAPRFPSMGEREAKRNKARRTLPVPPTPLPEAPAGDAGVAANDDPKPPIAVTRDPVLRVLGPPDSGKRALVFEASAFVHSPIGRLLLDCLSQAGRDPLGQGAKDVGFDLERDLDRVAMSGDTIVVSGRFDRLKRERPDLPERAIGDRGTIYGPTPVRENEETPRYFAMWGDEMLLLGTSEDELREAIDRLEGRAPPTEPAIPESEAYGDLYGVLPAKDLAMLLPDDQAALRDRIQEAISGATVHADATSDMTLSAELTGPDGERVADLGKTIGAALSVARVAASARGDDSVSELLEFARVAPGQRDMWLEMALPIAFFEKRFSDCAGGDTPKSEAAPPQAE